MRVSCCERAFGEMGKGSILTARNLVRDKENDGFLFTSLKIPIRIFRNSPFNSLKRRIKKASKQNNSAFGGVCNIPAEIVMREVTVATWKVPTAYFRI